MALAHTYAGEHFLWGGCTPGEHMFSACYGGRRIFPDWWIISKKTVNGLMNHNSTCFLLLTSRTRHVGAGTSKMKWRKHRNPCTFLYFTSVVSQSAKPAGFPPPLWLDLLLFWIEGRIVVVLMTDNRLIHSCKDVGHKMMVDRPERSMSPSTPFGLILNNGSWNKWGLCLLMGLHPWWSGQELSGASLFSASWFHS